MAIIQPVIKGKQPSGTITITSNTTTNVSDYEYAVTAVPTTAPAHYIEKSVDANGKLISGSTIMSFNGVTNIDTNYILAYAYYQNQAISGVVDMSDLTTISGTNSCGSMFSGCNNITSVNLSALTTISGTNSCGSMFQNSSGLTSANLSALTTISGTNACSYMFSGCVYLTSVNLSSLTTISGSCTNMFQGCISLTSMNLSALTTISGNGACSGMFFGCTSLATVYIGGTTAIDFGGKTNVFGNMFKSCTQNIDVYAPAGNQSAIEAFSDYPNFGATGTVTWHWRS